MIKVGLSTTGSFLISARCMVSGRVLLTPYNPHGNSQCEWFNRTLFSLMRSLEQEEKPNWPTYLPSLVFAYNATPHSSTGYQPYELMFGCKAPMACGNWLGLGNYKPASFKSKTAWLNEQLNAMLYANKQALKSIHKSTKCNKDGTSSKDITIPVGNHVVFRNHLDGCNKIQDHYKSEVYIMVGHHQEPNVYYIQLLNSSKPGQPKVVNRHQFYNLKRSVPPSVSPLGDDGLLQYHHSSTGNLIVFHPTLAILATSLIHIITVCVLNIRQPPLLTQWWWKQLLPIYNG